MAGIPWIKIATSLFDDEKIKVIEAMPEGDTLILIWIKLLCLAGKKNARGCIFLTAGVPYTMETLARALDRKIEIVKAAIAVFVKYQMLEIASNGVIMLINWDKHQNEDKLEMLREKTRKRVQNHRARQKLLSCNVTGNVTVTQNNAVDIDLEKDIDKEINTNLVNENDQPDILNESEVISQASPECVSEKSDINFEEVDELFPPEEEKTPQTPERVAPKREKPFDDFWSAYPRHAQKQDAIIAFEACTRSGNKADDLVLAAQNYRSKMESEGIEERYVMYPKKFLDVKREIWKEYLVLQQSKTIQEVVEEALSGKG